MLGAAGDRASARAILSNGEPAMLAEALAAAGIETLLDDVLSVEAVGVFKPDPRVYRLATDRFEAGGGTAWRSSPPTRGMRSARGPSAFAYSGSTAPASRTTSTGCAASVRENCTDLVRPARRASCVTPRRAPRRGDRAAGGRSRPNPRARPTLSPTTSSAPAASSARATAAPCRIGSGACCARVGGWTGGWARQRRPRLACWSPRRCCWRAGRWPASRRHSPAAASPRRRCTAPKQAILRRARRPHARPSRDARRGAAGSAGLAAARCAPGSARARRGNGARCRSPPPLDLRVNLLKATREEARAALAAEGLEATPTPLSPWGLRIAGRRQVTSGAAFRAGLVEIQDEGSQLVAALVDARPGMRVADWCAGRRRQDAGAGDDDAEPRPASSPATSPPPRLDGAVRRLRRAGVHNVERHLLEPGDKWVKRRAGSFDRVLVDAPCTGTGTWRRNPDARLRLTRGRSCGTFAQAGGDPRSGRVLVRIGGRLVYATCSLLPEENEAQVTAFLARHPGFVLSRWRGPGR